MVQTNYLRTGFNPKHLQRRFRRIPNSRNPKKTKSCCFNPQGNLAKLRSHDKKNFAIVGLSGPSNDTGNNDTS